MATEIATTKYNHIDFLPEYIPAGLWKVPPQPQSMLLTGDHFEYACNEVYWKTWQWHASSEIWRMFSYSFDWPGCVCGVVRNIKVVMADNTVSSFELNFYKR